MAFIFLRLVGGSLFNAEPQRARSEHRGKNFETQRREGVKSERLVFEFLSRKEAGDVFL